jgi:hypothetical protein
MAEAGKKGSESGTLGRLAERGEDALTKVLDELGKNPRVTDAIGRVMGAKGKVDETTRRTLGSVGLAAADEVKDLRKQLERLERRLAKLEGTGTRAQSTSSRKKTTSTKSSGGTARKASSGTGSKS